MSTRFTPARDEAAELLEWVVRLKAEKRPPLVRARTPLLLNHEQWAQQQALDYMAGIVKNNFAGLSDELKKRYVELQRIAVAALKAVEDENTRIRDTFKATHLQALKGKLKTLLGVDIDPESARIYTRYREFKEGRSPLDVLTGAVETEPGLTLNPGRVGRALDESRYVDRLHSITLWDAACANFGYATDSVLLKPFSYEQASYIRYDSLEGEHPVAPFVEIVRSLDIGSALATTLSDEMGDGGKLKRLIREASRANFEFELLEAHRNSAVSGIDRVAYTRLLNVLNHEIAADIRPMLMAREPNALLATYIPTPLVLIKFTGDAGTYSYFPQRLGGAIYFHEDGRDAIPHFKRQLIEDQRKRQLGWFARQWPLHELAHFQKLLSDEPRPKGLNPLAGLLYDGFHQVFPEPSLGNLAFFIQPPGEPKPLLVDWLAERQHSRYLANLEHLATTRSAADWQAFKEAASAIGNEVLGMLTTPMPGGVLGLNKIMQGAIFGSLAYSIAQGVIEATKGDASSFASAMSDTVDMLISGFITGWAGKAHRQRMHTLWNRTGRLRKVTREDGTVELWNPDLNVYPRLEADALDTLTPTDEGVYQHDGKLYAKVQEGDAVHVLEVIRDASGKTFRLKPRDSRAFKPVVVFDATSAVWRLVLEDVQRLSDTQLLERMLPLNPPTKMPADLQRTLSITGTTREQLLNTWQGQPIPGPLADGVRRLQADRLIDQIISDFTQRGNMPVNGESAVFALLTRLEYWPVDTVLDIYNQQGELTHTYGTDHNAEAVLNRIELKRLDHGAFVARDDVAQTAVREEQLFTLIIDQMPGTSLLGVERDRVLSKTGRIALVREQIAGLAKTERGLLFKALTVLEGRTRNDSIATTDAARKYLPLMRPPVADSTTPLLAKLHELNPSLSIECLEPLLAAHPFTPYQESRALGPDNAQPLPFDRAVEQLAIKLRVDLALDGIYHSRTHHTDSDSWAREFAKGVLNDTLQRDLVVTDVHSAAPRKYYEPSGPDDKTVELRDYGSGQYEAYDFRNGGPIPVAPGNDQFYLAISSRLQPHERTQLGMNSDVDVLGLRQRVGDEMLAQRQLDGEVNLWDTSLGQYERDKTLVHDKTPGDLGLYEIDVSQYLALNGTVYQVQFDATRLKWRLKHPEKVGVNTPTLEHNGDGAWRQSSENPLEWSGVKLLRRLRAERVGISDRIGQQIMDVSNIDEGVLRQVHMNNLKPPPIVMDTWKRFRLVDDIQRFIDDLQSPQTLSRARSDLQLVLLQSVAGWPWGKVLQIVDKNGAVLKEYGPDLSANLPRTRIIYDDTRNGSFLRALLLQMDEADTRLLLGEYSPRIEERMFALGKKIAEKAREHSANVFEILYDRQERSRDPRTQVVQKAHPKLPVRVIEHLLQYTTPTEQKQLLDAGFVPPRMGEQINLTAREVRLARAYEGLYLDATANPDSERLTLHMLPALAGWPAGISIEVRQHDVNGAVIDRMGPLNNPHTRILVKYGKRYRAYSQEGVALNPESTTHNNLLSSILHSLDDTEREAIAIKSVSDTSTLAGKISELAVKHRSSIRTLLGLQAPPPWQRPPMKVDSSFIAYPLILSYENSSHSLDLVRQVRGLYPALTYEGIIRFLDDLGGTETSRLAVLATRRAQFNTLQIELTRWEMMDMYPTTTSHVGVSTVAHRQQVRATIESAWRRETPISLDDDGTPLGYLLDLYHLEVGDLPALTGDFSHVGVLVMNGMNLHRGSNSFLSSFTGLRRLLMSDNSLTTLPPAIANMPHLRTLGLVNNRIVLTPESVQLLAGCTRLHSLFLNDNPLGLAPDVTHMSDLRELRLNNTGINQWPVGLPGLTQLALVDLRSNQITTIPQAVFDAPETSATNRATRLQGNPLTVQTYQQLTAYRARTRIGMGFIPVRFHTPAGQRSRAELISIDPWLSNMLTPGQLTQKIEQWSLITRPKDAARHFTDMLKDLAVAQQAMKEPERARLKERVWSMISSLLANTVLRDRLMGEAYVPTCEDGVMVVFVNMEMKVLTHDFEQRVRASENEADYFNFARMLFRLEQVDAMSDAAIARLEAQGGEGVDSFEIALHYRIKLAEPLDLPIHTEAMLYSSEVQLTDAEITRIKTEILEKEASPAFTFSITHQPFWLGHTKKKHADRFATLEAEYQKAYEDLSAETGLSDEVELQRGLQLTEARDQRINLLIEELTDKAKQTADAEHMDVTL